MALNEASTSAPSISVRFWGVRGSIACPGPTTLRYGGNTPCVEVRCGADTLIFDAGTGIRALGNALIQAADTTDFDIFLSHGHIDHVIGLPFFAPLFVRGSGGPRVGRQPAARRRRPGGGAKIDELSVLPASGRRAACRARIPRLPRRRRHQSPARRHAANRAAQSSRRRDRLSDRVRRPVDRLCDRYRTGRRPDRSGAAGADQGRRAA